MSYFKATLYGATGLSASIGTIVSQLTNGQLLQGPPSYWNAIAVVFYVTSAIELAHQKHEVEA